MNKQKHLEEEKKRTKKSSWKKKRRKQNTGIFCGSWMKKNGDPAVRIGEGEINGKLGVGCSKA